MNKFASLCILSYKRVDMLQQCLKSLHETIDSPCEIIINFDGVEDNVMDWDMSMIQTYALHLKASKYIIAKGKNRGVGRSFQNCLGVAEGDYIFKIDTDLIFKPHWLSTAIDILDNNIDVGAISLFNYKHYNPKEERFNILEERTDCFIVDDFVSSIYGFRKDDLGLDAIPYTIPDDGLHKNLVLTTHRKLAITKEDFVTNTGFGLGRSVYVVPDKDGNPMKAKTYNTPLLFST